MKNVTFQGLREKERIMRKLLIIEAAEKIFTRQTFDKILMKDIADEARISVGSIYTYFESQEELLLEIISRHFEKIEAKIEGMARAGKFNYEDVIATVVDYFLTNENFSSILCHFMVQRKKRSEKLNRFGSIKKIFFDMFNKAIERAGYGKKKGESIFSDALLASLLGVIIANKNGSIPGEDPDHYIRKIAMMTSGMNHKANPEVVKV